MAGLAEAMRQTTEAYDNARRLAILLHECLPKLQEAAKLAAVYGGTEEWQTTGDDLAQAVQDACEWTTDAVDILDEWFGVGEP